MAIDETGAVVETEGRRRRASTFLVPDLAVGDWVLVGAGTILDRLSPDRAEEIRATLDEAIARDGDTRRDRNGRRPDAEPVDRTLSPVTGGN